MNKILLALAILGAGTAGALTARHSTTRLQREASATRESWIVQTQVLAAAQGEQVRLAERIRELKQNLSQAEAAGNQSGLWSVLETNRIGHLAPDLREYLLEELGFNWTSSEAFIVVSKETVRLMRVNIPMIADRQGKLTDCDAAVLGLTPQERSEVEAALERVQVDLRDWAISHTERSEPRDDVVAHYTLQSAPPTSITNNLITEVFNAIGKERTELIMPSGSWQNFRIGSVQHWMGEIGFWVGDKPTTMILKRFSDGNKQVVKFQEGDAGPGDEISKRNFPEAFRPVFPNGWADVAEREGFELPQEFEHK